MDDLIDNFKEVEKSIADEKSTADGKPVFILFGLFLREDAEDKWDLVISADWFEEDRRKTLDYTVERLKSYIKPMDMTRISRIILLEPSDDFVKNINNTVSIEHGKAQFEDTQFGEMTVKRAFVITSKKPLKRSIVKTSKLNWNDTWVLENHKTAMSGLGKIGRTAFMEIRMNVPEYKLEATQAKLLEAAKQAQINTFGWPIGIVIEREGYSPTSRSDGIYAEIIETEEDYKGRSYDHWILKRDGEFYLLKDLFEDSRKPGYIFINTRIVRIAEALLYCERLYSDLDVPNDSRVLIGIRHGGLQDRILTVSSPASRLPPPAIYKSKEKEVYTEFEITLGEIEKNLVDLVSEFVHELFIVFNFFELKRNVIEDIVNNFVNGKVT